MTMTARNGLGSRIMESSYSLGPLYIVCQTAETLVQPCPRRYVDRERVGFHVGFRCLGHVFSREYGLQTHNPGWLEHIGVQIMQPEQLTSAQGER